MESCHYADGPRGRMPSCMKIELNCAVCGENKFDLREDHANDAHVYCAVCGHEIGTLAELKERVADEVLRRSRVDRGGSSA